MEELWNWIIFYQKILNVINTLEENKFKPKNV